MCIFFNHFFSQINAAAEVIYEASNTDANIIFGTSVDESMDGNIAITVIATGFPIPEDANDDGTNLPPAKKIFEKFRDPTAAKNQ